MYMIKVAMRMGKRIDSSCLAKASYYAQTSVQLTV